MRFNNKEMIHISHSNPVFEGRMSYAKLSNGYSSKGNYGLRVLFSNNTFGIL